MIRKQFNSFGIFFLIFILFFNVTFTGCFDESNNANETDLSNEQVVEDILTAFSSFDYIPTDNELNFYKNNYDNTLTVSDIYSAVIEPYFFVQPTGSVIEPISKEMFINSIQSLVDNKESTEYIEAGFDVIFGDVTEVSATTSFRPHQAVILMTIILNAGAAHLNGELTETYSLTKATGFGKIFAGTILYIGTLIAGVSLVVSAPVTVPVAVGIGTLSFISLCLVNSGFSDIENGVNEAVENASVIDGYVTYDPETESNILGVPIKVRASDGEYDDRIEISWGNVIGAERYYIYRSTSSSDNGSVLDSYTTTPLYSDVSVVGGTTYYYRVRAWNSDEGFSEFSSYNTGHIAEVETPDLISLDISLYSGNYSTEISWSIDDSSGTEVASSSSYSNDNYTYTSIIDLESGVYTLNCYDSYGDGWNGGYITIMDGSTVLVDEFTFTSGSSSSTTFTVGGGSTGSPDLVVDSVSISTTSVNAGATMPVTLTLANTGTKDSGSFRYGIYISTNSTISTSDTLVYYHTVSSGISAGSSMGPGNVTATIPSSVSAGTYYIGVIVDDLDSVSEANESNNTGCASSTVAISSGSTGSPDLVVDSVSISTTSVNAGATMPVTLALANTGTKDSGSFRYGIYISTNSTISTSDTLVYYHTVSSGISAGSSMGPGNVTATIPSSASAGIYYIGVIVDDLDSLSESNESNNTGCASSTVAISTGSTGSPDLVVDSVSISTTSISAGSSLLVSRTLSNDGTVNSGSFRYGVYLSTNSTISTSDTLLISYSVAVIAAGSSIIYDNIITIIPSSVSAGTYYIGVIVDDLDSVSESDESNNTGYASSILTVSAGSATYTAQDLIDLGPFISSSYETIHTYEGVVQVLGFHYLSDGTIRSLCYIEADDEIKYHGDNSSDWKVEDGLIYLGNASMDYWTSTGTTVQSIYDSVASGSTVTVGVPTDTYYP